MKALIISEETSIVNTLSTFFKANNIDVIVYKWLLKALDNIEEIAPDLIVLNTAEYPRHWKTLVQFVKSGIGAEKVCVFLYEQTELSNEDFMKAEALDVNGSFKDLTEDTFKAMKSEIDRFFSSSATIENNESGLEELHNEVVDFSESKPEYCEPDLSEDPEFDEVPTVENIIENKNSIVEEENPVESSISGDFMITNPVNNNFVFGKATLSNDLLTLQNLNLPENCFIKNGTFISNEKSISFTAQVFNKQSNSLILKIREL